MKNFFSSLFAFLSCYENGRRNFQTCCKLQWKILGHFMFSTEIILQLKFNELWILLFPSQIAYWILYDSKAVSSVLVLIFPRWMLSTWYKNQFDLMLNNGVICELLRGIYSTVLRLTIVVRLMRIRPADTGRQGFFYFFLNVNEEHNLLYIHRNTEQVTQPLPGLEGCTFPANQPTLVFNRYNSILWLI